MSVFRKDSLALITGGASGIGLAVAEICVKHGMRVAVVDNNYGSLEKAKKHLSSVGDANVETFEADVSKEEDWSNLKREVQKRFGLGDEGGPDFLMLNAGVGARGTWGDGEYFQKVRCARWFPAYDTSASEVSECGASLERRYPFRMCAAFLASYSVMIPCGLVQHNEGPRL